MTSATVFPDTNVFIQLKDLKVLPWRELFPEIEHVAIIVARSVVSELDKHKVSANDRRRDRARLALKLIDRASAAPARTITLKETPVKVTLTVAPKTRPDWQALSELDPKDPDDQLVAAAVVFGNDAVLLSHDSGPRISARDVGLSAYEPPEAWLLPAEQSKDQKKVAQLERQLEQERNRRPKLTLQLHLDSGEPIRLVRVRPLSSSEVAIIADMWLERNPAHQPHWAEIARDFSYGGDYERFEQRVHKYGSRLHTRLERLFNQIACRIALSNEGSVPAEHVELQLDATGARLHDRFVLGKVMLPKPPEYHAGGPLVHFPNTIADLVVARPGRNEIAFDPPAERGSAARLACEDFRQGRAYQRRIYATLDPYSTTPASLQAMLTAKNLHGQIAADLALPFEVEDLSHDELIDVMASQFARPFPLLDLVTELIKSGYKDELSFPAD